MNKSFPRPRRRGADDAALVELLRDSPWERAMRESLTSIPAAPFQPPDRGAQAETPRGR